MVLATDIIQNREAYVKHIFGGVTNPLAQKLELQYTQYVGQSTMALGMTYQKHLELNWKYDSANSVSNFKTLSRTAPNACALTVILSALYDVNPYIIFIGLTANNDFKRTQILELIRERGQEALKIVLPEIVVAALQSILQMQYERDFTRYNIAVDSADLQKTQAVFADFKSQHLIDLMAQDQTYTTYQAFFGAFWEAGKITHDITPSTPKPPTTEGGTQSDPPAETQNTGTQSDIPYSDGSGSDNGGLIILMILVAVALFYFGRR